jgi:hypothetical protein
MSSDRNTKRQIKVKREQDNTQQETTSTLAEDTQQATTEQVVEDTQQTTTEQVAEDTQQTTTEQVAEDTQQTTTEQVAEDDPPVPIGYPFLGFADLEIDTVYTVKSFQWLHWSVGALYIIYITKPNDETFGMVVTDGSTEIDLYLKLESIKTLPKPAKFTFAKKEIQYSSSLKEVTMLLC